jgi:hypothetical protein
MIHTKRITQLLMSFILVFGVLISATLANVSARSSPSITGNIKGDGDSPPVEELRIVDPDEYVRPDKDWPIVGRERKEYVDPATGVRHEEELIIRSLPANVLGSSRIQDNVCQKTVGYMLENFLGSFNIEDALAATCVFQAYESQTRSHTIWSGANSLIGYVTSYAEKHCAGSCTSGTFWKPYRSDYSWRRNNSNWTAKEATYRWGCPIECPKCAGGTYLGGPVRNTIGTVAWNNNTQSKVYISSSSSIPPIDSPEAAPVAANSFAKGYFGGVYVGEVRPVVTWP